MKLRLAVADQRDRIVEIICEETGKPALDALSGDVLVTLEQMRYYEARAASTLKTRKVGKPALLYTGVRFYEQYEPHGVVLIFAPSNYPFQLAMVPMATALYAGNAVILKCSERTPLLADLMQDLCRAADIPEHLVQVVHDRPEDASAYIDAGPDLIFFTGSCQNGRAVAKRAAERLIPCVMELGGKDAAIVFADCNLERTVEGIVYGAFSNAGQVCVGIKRLYVERALYPALVEKIAQRMGKLRIGTARDADLGELHGDKARSQFTGQIQEALDRGAVLHSRSSDLSGSEPIVLTDVPPDSRLLREETFGPVLCVAPFQNETEAVALANSSEFALSASVWTSDAGRARRVAQALNAGSCAVNDVIRNIANPHASFGGNRQSGFGRYHGAQGLYAFSRIKSVMLSSGKKGREINWFPFTETTLNRLGMLIGIRHGRRGWLAALRRLFFLLLCASLPTLAVAQHAGAGHLLLRVATPQGTHGAIAYLVFASPDGFPTDKAKALRSGFAPFNLPLPAIDVGELPPGRYAVSVYQDINGNGKLDTGLFGIPKEPVGVSNNPHPSFGPPRFNDCLFTMGNSDQTISISMVQVK